MNTRGLLEQLLRSGSDMLSGQSGRDQPFARDPALGRAIRYLVPRAVEELIVDRRLYRR